eukprot:scaffold5042_cov23-Cyclotella_meneghiniana.AAC.2
MGGIGSKPRPGVRPPAAPPLPPPPPCGAGAGAAATAGCGVSQAFGKLDRMIGFWNLTLEVMSLSSDIGNCVLDPVAKLPGLSFCAKNVLMSS